MQVFSDLEWSVCRMVHQQFSILKFEVYFTIYAINYWRFCSFVITLLLILIWITLQLHFFINNTWVFCFFCNYIFYCLCKVLNWVLRKGRDIEWKWSICTKIPHACMYDIKHFKHHNNTCAAIFFFLGWILCCYLCWTGSVVLYCDTLWGLVVGLITSPHYRILLTLCFRHG